MSSSSKDSIPNRNPRSILGSITYSQNDDDDDEDQGSPNYGKLKGISSEFVTMAGVEDKSLKARRSSIFSKATSENLIESTASAAAAEGNIESRLDDYDQVTLDSVASGQSSGNKKYNKEDLENWEVWWVTSPTWRRTVVFMCILMFFLTILHTILAAYTFSISDAPHVHPDVDPYICRTQDCIEISDWISSSMDLTVDPCDNFYEFVCGKYTNPFENPDATPDRVTFEKARTGFNGQALSASLLKPRPKNKEKVIPFYKACLDTNRRDKNNMDIFVEILNDTIKHFFDNVENFDTLSAARIVSSVTGRYGLFSFQFLDFPNVAFLPPAEWIGDFRTHINDNVFTGDLVKKIALPNFFNRLWSHLKFTNPPMTAMNASGSFLDYFEIISRGERASPGDKLNERISARVDTVLNNTFKGQKVTLKTSPILNRLFTRLDLVHVVQAMNKELTRPQIQRSVTTFAIMNYLQYFSKDFRGIEYDRLKLPVLFPELNEERLLTEEQYCFNALLKYLNGHTILRLIDEIDFDESGPQVARTQETVRRIQRAFRRYHKQIFHKYLSPDHNLATEVFASHKTFFKLSSPFPSKDEKNSFFADANSFYDNFVPGPDHLRNIYQLSKLFHAGILQNWQDNKIGSLKRQNYFLERVEQYSENFVDYENTIYPSISLFDLPFYTEDLRACRYAGQVTFLASSFLTLWVDNLMLLEKDRAGPLVKNINLPEWEELFNRQNFLQKNYVTCLTGDPYTNPYNKSTEILNFDVLLHALAFKLSVELWKHKTLYDTLRDKRTGELHLNLEPDFLGEDGSVEYVDVSRESEDANRKFPKVNPDDYDPYNPTSFRLLYRRAPGSLKKFSEEQLFYLTAIRHHCYPKHQRSTDKRNRIASTLNQALSQLPEFAKAWGCRVDAPMNPSRKCL